MKIKKVSGDIGHAANNNNPDSMLRKTGEDAFKKN